ncbi:MAG: ATP-grasp domain-containing protein [Planctomycetota bacterium]
MKIFVYEHLCATSPSSQGADSLEREGRAMLHSVLSDLASLGDVDLYCCLHPGQPRPALPRLHVLRANPTLRQAVMQIASMCDGSLVIAPETDGILGDVVQWVLNAGGTLLGPDLATIKLFSDKIETAQLLGPKTIPSTILPDLPHNVGPLVVKPRYGAGSAHTVIGPRVEVNAMMAAIRCQDYSGELISQPFWPGLPASIAMVVRATGQAVILPAAEQIIDTIEIGPKEHCRSNGFRWLHYKGGRMPLSLSHHRRARALAEFLLSTTPGIRGYIGIDLVLAPDDEGTFDRIVEVNPRLTTSYTGYSQLLGGSTMGRLLLDRETNATCEFDCFLNNGKRLRYQPDGIGVWEHASIQGR